ncbi:MAG: hypothetical protein AB4372_21120 [Xenococcus sp. (in: cyanobacteria)]
MLKRKKTIVQLNQIKLNFVANKHFLQSLSIKDLDEISGGPGDPMCPYCAVESN